MLEIKPDFIMIDFISVLIGRGNLLCVNRFKIIACTYEGKISLDIGTEIMPDI
jgi:hypothetical protein